MKIFTSLLCICGLITSVTAQPVINQNHVFSPGDVVHGVIPEIFPNPGPAGENMTWDYSTLVFDSAEILTVEFILPDTTPYFDQFPESNIAQLVDIQGFQFYQYSKLTNASFEIHGDVIPGTSITTYPNPETIMEFPMTYLSTWEDDYTSNFEFLISPVTYTGEGTDASVVDAYGTLHLPGATFDDVLRVKTINYSTDTASLGQGLSERNFYYDTSYFWISPSYHGPLANYSRSMQTRIVYLITEDTVITDQETSFDETFSFDPFAEPNPSSGVHAVPGQYKLQVSPNPFTESLHLVFDTGHNGPMEFILQNLNGQTVYSATVSAIPGKNSADLGLPYLPSGMYVGILRSSSGADVQKLVCLQGSR